MAKRVTHDRRDELRPGAAREAYQDNASMGTLTNAKPTTNLRGRFPVSGPIPPTQIGAKKAG